MAQSIPASAIANVIPNVLSAGGSGLDLVGLILTNSTRVPIGTVARFSSAADVTAHFGALTTEETLATTYFAGYDGSTIKPAMLLFSQYATAAVGAFLRGGDVSGMTLAQLQALSGTLTIAVNGSNKTSSTINLSTATSFSNAATMILAGFTSPGFTVTYDAISGAFVFTNSTTGAASTMGFATGTLSAGLKLTAAAGAVVSPGSDVMVPATAMNAVIAQTQDFVSFMTSWLPADADKLAFAAWADSKSDRYLYAMGDSNAAATQNGDTTSAGSQIKAGDVSGVAPIFDPNNPQNVCAWLMGTIASIDFQAANGRITAAFRSGEITAGVTNQTIADNLIANGYNFVGSYATANDEFTFFYPGQISGKFEWIDSWVNQCWMNSGFQLALMTLLTSAGSIPYNLEGYSLIETALSDQINQALNFGAIRAGVTLSAQQAAEIDAAAGVRASDTVQQRGWYVRVQDASPQVRAARGSPPVAVWYTDGQSVQKITLSSVNVQ